MYAELRKLIRLRAFLDQKELCKHQIFIDVNYPI